MHNADGVRVTAAVSTSKTRHDYVPEKPTWAELLGLLSGLMRVNMFMTSYGFSCALAHG